MPLIRTVFRPFEEVEVSEEEEAAMARMGLLSRVALGEPEVVGQAPAEPDAETAPDPDPAPKPRRGKTADTTPASAEEVNTDGSSEQGGGQEVSQQEG